MKLTRPYRLPCLAVLLTVLPAPALAAPRGDESRDHAAVVRPLELARERLLRRVTVGVRDEPADRAVRRLAEAAECRISFDWAQVRPEGGPERAPPVSLQFYDVPAAIALNAVIARANLVPTVAVVADPAREDAVLVVPVKRLRPVRLVYELADLARDNAVPPAGSQEVVEQTSQMIQQLVAADTWADNGGETGRVETPDNGSRLLMTATPDVHEQVGALLGHVRAVLGGRPAGDMPALRAPGGCSSSAWRCRRKVARWRRRWRCGTATAACRCRSTGRNSPPPA